MINIILFDEKQMTTQDDIRHFNMESITKHSHPPNITFIGRREARSLLIRDLLNSSPIFQQGTVVSSNEEASLFASPQTSIHREFSTTIIEKIISQQKEFYKQGLTVPRTFLLLDDCLGNNWAKDKLMRMLFLNGRNWKIMLIITMETPLIIPPLIRTNADYVFILCETSQANRKRIYDNYASRVSTFDVFCKLLDQIAESNECLVIDNKAKTNRLEDLVFSYGSLGGAQITNKKSPA